MQHGLSLFFRDYPHQILIAKRTNMKFYKLTDSNVIDYIRTCSTSGLAYNMYIQIHYKDGDSKKIKRDFIATIRNLLESKLIDATLAQALYKDFPLFHKRKPVTFAKSDVSSPFICYNSLDELLNDRHRIQNDNKNTINSDNTDDHPAEKKAQPVEQKLSETEALNIRMALFFTADEKKKTMLEEAQSYNDKVVSLNFVKAGIENSQTSPPFSIFSKLGEEVQLTNEYKHKISNVECTFMHDPNGILLVISGEKDNLIVTAAHKKQILSCKHLFRLADTLATIEGGQSLAMRMKELSLLEHGPLLDETLEEVNGLEHFNESENDEDDITAYGEFFEDNIDSKSDDLPKEKSIFRL